MIIEVGKNEVISIIRLDDNQGMDSISIPSNMQLMQPIARHTSTLWIAGFRISCETNQETEALENKITQCLNGMKVGIIVTGPISAGGL